jgi:energy-coupling factor transporter ATP-binding protein EcfA2
MYLTDAVILNNGSLAKLELVPEFHADGSPKPLVLVGPNGCGKTNLLSTISDALHELAALHYQDVLPTQGTGHQFFRILGGTTQRTGAAFELSALKFKNVNDEFTYLAKCGTLPPQPRPPELVNFPQLQNWPAEGGHKHVQAAAHLMEQIFRGGAYAFFPTDRSEVPYWLNVPSQNLEPNIQFQDVFSNQLRKPLMVKSTVDDVNNWLADLLLDIAVDAVTVVQANDLQTLKMQAAPQLNNTIPFMGLIAIMRSILRCPTARFARVGRAWRARKIMVVDENNKPVLQSFRQLSSGQATLLSIFGTILRYGDYINQPQQNIEGIVIVDEVDAHLHSDLQHDVLPELINLFPKIQFILSSHAPLFPLGMQKRLGEAGFTLIELPSGTRITAERFSEFERSFEYYRETKTFEENVATTVSASAKPLVLCEGETDPIYLKAAAGLLGMADLANRINFDWVGKKAGDQSTGAGKDNLNSAYKFLKHNPSYLHFPTLLLYDADANKPIENGDKLFVRCLEKNGANNVCRAGIENLLPEAVFEDRFYDRSEKITADQAIIRKLRKMDLCRWLCETRRDPAHFEKFHAPLEEIARTLP